MIFKISPVALCLLLFVPYTIEADEMGTPSAQFKQQVHEVEGYLLSPFCPGRLLRDCPSSGAAELKQEIRNELRGGKTPLEVREFLLAKYGESIRAAPQSKGFGLFAWLTPLLFLLVGAGVGSVWLKNMRRKSSPSELAPEQPQLTPEMKERIKQELK